MGFFKEDGAAWRDCQIGGAFIGIQVAKRNAERSDRVESSNVLKRLEQEIQMHLKRIDRSLAMNNDEVFKVERLLRPRFRA